MTYNLGEKLKKYGLDVRHVERSRDDDDYEPIDFAIDDGVDNVAWVWGSHPTNDIQIECNHPEGCIEFGDDDELGECKLCGARCVWHYVPDEGNVEGYYWHNEMRVPDFWTSPKHIGGLVGEYLADLAKRF